MHKAYRPPYAARAPAEKPRKPPHPPPGWYTPQAAVYKPARPTLPPPGGLAERDTCSLPPPELKPRAKTWDGVRDGGPNSQKTPEGSRSKLLRTHSLPLSFVP